VSGRETAAAGQWIELEFTLLAAGERKGVPEDTAATPLRCRVRGFAAAACAVGQEAEVTTLAGRRVTGTVRTVAPAHTHGFGRPDPELLRVGPSLRARRAP